MTSASRTASFTITDARYVGAKIGADLRILHNLYGHPSLSSIDAYAEEVAILLRDGYLNTVDYGFRHPATDAWKYRVRYSATEGGRLLDSRPGRLPLLGDIVGLGFYSFLTYAQRYLDLSADQRASIQTTLPIHRTVATEPTALSGSTVGGNAYSSNGAGVNRNVYSAF